MLHNLLPIAHYQIPFQFFKQLFHLFKWNRFKCIFELKNGTCLDIYYCAVLLTF